MTDQTEKKIEQGGLTLILLRNAFYRDNYRRALFVLSVLVLINTILFVSIVYRYLHPQEPQYFATNPQYQLIKWRPLSDPDVSDRYVLQWVANAVQQAFALDYIHWRSQLQNASVNFTPNGWSWFIKALTSSGDLETLTKLNMVSNIEVTGAPRILNSSVLQGRYVWQVQLPMMITYTNPTMPKTINLPLKVVLMVVRVPVQDNPHHIAINQFLTIPQGASQ